jgi:hypothetical protein
LLIWLLIYIPTTLYVLLIMLKAIWGGRGKFYRPTALRRRTTA